VTGVAESTGARKLYRGWIPTISGALSFSVFGETRHPRAAVFANTADDKIRYLSVYQFRNAADVLVPWKDKLAPFLFGIDGRIWFVFLAKTEAAPGEGQHYLVGRAFMFTDLDAWAKSISPGVDSYHALLNQFELFDHADLRQYAERQFTSITDLCTKTCAFYVDARICRTGTTEISFPWPLALSSSAPTLPSEPMKLGLIVHILASQTFYFLKDIGHRHQHHHESTDQIVLLYEIEGDDDVAWRRSTIFGIYRKVIQLKRDPHVSTFSDALGLIAYGESFRGISNREVGQGKLPEYYAKETADSIRSTQARVEREASQRQKRIDIFRNLVISLAGILFSFMGLLKLSKYQSDVTPNPALTSFLDWLLLNPFLAVGGAAILLIAGVIFFNYRASDVSALAIKAIRPVQFLPRTVVATWLFVAAYLCALWVVKLLK
jgi:hypothetical protein